MPNRTTQLDLLRAMSREDQQLYHKGLTAHLKDDKPTAMRHYRKLLKRSPRCWPARYSVAVLAHHLLEHRFAVKELREIVRSVPGFMEALFNLGTILQTIGEYTEAEAVLRRAMALDPTFCGTRTNLGNALLGLGRFPEAVAEYEVAMTLTPNNAEATWNLAHVLIVLGHWERGWACYEARWELPTFVSANAVEVDVNRADAPAPWRGASLAGRTLVVAGEQGHGDNIMCLRYAPILRGMAKEVIWALNPPLLRLAASSVFPDRVVSIESPLPPADYIISTMSLHNRLSVTPETVPFPEGFLKVA